MSANRTIQGIFKSAGFALVFAASAIMAAAQATEIHGMIKARDGATMVVQTGDNSELTVLLTDSTSVGQNEGLFKARHKEMSMAALIPGLEVNVKGASNDQNQFVAQEVRFNGNDLERAKSIQAGMHETAAQAEANRLQAEANRQQAEANRIQAEKNRQVNEAQEKALAEHKAAIDDAIARFGQLDDYYIFDEVTIYFKNGKKNVDPQYVPQLQALAQKAAGINGYMIEVKGFASQTGNPKVNQALSEDRAENVTNILIQQCKIPMTRMLAPGAMGESEQVGDTKTKEGEAQNRRVTVRVLQNKAIAGKMGAPAGQ
ncbi:MAG TPA: OmpA family protein [Terracidiphilus sp.]|nr:OmpA family protein [Terracidiphilus sp.]